MWDEKIAMILLPLWLATVLATMYLGITRPRLSRIVGFLTEQGCDSPQGAKTAKELGISCLWERTLLRPAGSLRRLVKAVEAPRQTALRVKTDKSEPVAYYLPPEHREKAEVLYGKKTANIWQSIGLSLLLTAVFFGLWMAASLVFDTSDWKPLFF